MREQGLATIERKRVALASSLGGSESEQTRCRYLITSESPRGDSNLLLQIEGSIQLPEDIKSCRNWLE